MRSNKLSAYQALSIGYSPLLNCAAIRISLVDDCGQEFWTLIPQSSGKTYRESRDKALDALMDAAERGDAPGEVTL